MDPKEYWGERLRYWQARLRLQDWRIELRWSAAHELSEVPPGVLGETHINERFQRATVALLRDDQRPPAHRSSLDLERTLLHELLHIKLHDLLMAARRREDFETLEERVVEHLAEALSGEPEAEDAA